jgi:dTDP-4-amino-4,6-dideoxygalactose transaminase
MIGSEEKAAVMRVMDRGILSGYQGNWSDAFYGGEEVHALEKEWAEYFGVKHAIAVNSATSGLWAACAAIGLTSPFELATEWDSAINCPDEIIVSPYSMTCSASIPLHFGAKPVFADIEPDYYCLDPASVEAAITEHTKAIIVVDLFGQPYDADAINAIAKKHGIMVIEDAAQAIGATYKGRYAGTLGDIGVFSLNRHKHIQCGEGGVVVTDNDELATRLRLLMNHAEAVVNDMDRQGELDMQFVSRSDMRINNLVGLNLRMTELQAAIAREQLKKLEGILETVREHAKYFPVKVRPGCEHAYYRYAFHRKNEPAFNKKAPLFNVKRHYITPLYKMPLFKALGYQDGLCPVCEEVEENIVLAWLKETP